jgi:flavin reductase (DIM6/NTAB) family NADH-FMN oxidoreductase RutF
MKIKLENQAVGPFPAMIVGAMAQEKPTYTLAGAGGCACHEPVLCVSLKNTHYITAGILQSGYFSINIPSAALVKKMDFCGMASGHDTDKSSLFTAFYDEAGKAPLITECPLNFLCRVCDSKEIRGFTMFFGDITAAFADEDCLIQGQPDPLKIDPVIMMAFNYLNIKSIIGRPFGASR